MPFWGKRTRFRAGRPIVARDLNRVAEAAERAALIQANPPLAIVSTPGGPLLNYAGPVFQPYLAKATTTITALSGTTPGSGTVKVETWDGTALADLGGPVTFTTYSLSTSAIASGSYVTILKIAGAYWVVSAAPGHAWCHLASSLGPATGTWPSLTPTSQLVTAYSSAGGALTSLGSATAYNWRNVTWATGKTTYLAANPDGTYDVVDQDC